MIGRSDIDLKLTLIDSAQCFHWVENEDKFGAFIDDKPVWLTQENEDIYAFSDCEKEKIADYLDLDRDYSLMADEVKDYPKAYAAIKAFNGIRVLNQPAWETLISFIISANNNVSRIKGIVNRLLTNYGEAVETEFGVLYKFPTAERLSECTVEEMHALGLGYRDRYIVESSKAIRGGFDLDALRDMDFETAHKKICTLMGVGDKVADCILLFGCGHKESFPVDVWIDRMCRSVFGLEAKNRKELSKMARDLLGNDAGLIQQYLFHAARSGYLEV